MIANDSYRACNHDGFVIKLSIVLVGLYEWLMGGEYSFQMLEVLKDCNFNTIIILVTTILLRYPV